MDKSDYVNHTERVYFIDRVTAMEYTPTTDIYRQLTEREFCSGLRLNYFLKAYYKTLNGDYKTFTELIMCVQHKIYEMSEKKGWKLPFSDFWSSEEFMTIYVSAFRKLKDEYEYIYRNNYQAMEYLKNRLD